MGNQYNLLFTGKFQPDVTTETLRSRLAGIYGKRTDDVLLDSFFKGAAIILMKNVSLETVNKGKTRFETIGLECNVVPVTEVEADSKGPVEPDKKFNLVSTGCIKEGIARHTVQANLSKIYGKRTGDQIIDTLYCGKPSVIVRNLKKSAVEKNFALFSEAGLICEIVEADGVELALGEADGRFEGNIDVGLNIQKKSENEIRPRISITTKQVEDSKLPEGMFLADKAVANGFYCRSCNGNLKEGQVIMRCPSCGAYYDRVCWEKNRGCNQWSCAQNVNKPAAVERQKTIQDEKAAHINPGDAKDIMSAVGAGIFSGVVTLGLWIYAVNSGTYPLGLPIDTWSILDVILITGLTFGIYKRSRACAVAMLIYYIAGRIYLSYETNTSQFMVSTLLFTYFFYRGVRGTFRYHTYK